MTKEEKACELQRLAFKRLKDAVRHVWAIHELLNPNATEDVKLKSIGEDSRIMLDHVLKYYEHAPPAPPQKTVGKLEVKAFDKDGNEVEVKR